MMTSATTIPRFSASALSSYQSRRGGAFAFADELAKKRQTLREVEEALARSARGDAEADRVAYASLAIFSR